jgi:LPXTG-motif cell wall-anchored protein
VDSSTGHSSSAMLMLLSVVFVGLAVFLIYKFKRYVVMSFNFYIRSRFAEDYPSLTIFPHLMNVVTVLLEAFFGIGEKQE